MDQDPTEAGLVRKAQGGDQAAFEELVRRTTRSVYARVYLEVGDRHLAEDLVQETFLTAYRAIGQVSRPEGFRSWLGTVAQTVVLDHFRYSGRKRRSGPAKTDAEVLDRTAADESGPGESLESAESREKVRAILHSMPEEYRLPLTLRYIDGQDYESISLQLGLTNGSLRGRLNRGLQLLRGLVKRALGTRV